MGPLSRWPPLFFSLFNPLAPQESPQISRAVHNSEDFDSTSVRAIEHEHFFEAGYRKDSQFSEFRMFETGMPSYIRICGQQSKRFVSGKEKSVAGFGIRFSRQIIGWSSRSRSALGRMT